jgi:hypothetical protein
LNALLEAATKAGARFAHPAPLRLYSSIRDHFLPVIDANFPALAQRYRDVYRGQGLAPARYSKALSLRFRNIAGRHGLRVDEFPKHSGNLTASADRAPQLALWREGTG